MGEWTYNSTVIDLGTSFTPQSHYPRGRSPRYPLYKRLGGPRKWSEHFGEEKILALAGIRNLAVQTILHRYTE
jgi:hypothetical protein